MKGELKVNFNIGIKPFNDFWLNCRYNMLFSILSTIDSSYRLAASMNDYSYNVSEKETPTGTKYNKLLIDPMVEFQEKYLYEIASIQPFNFKHDENYIEYLKNLIKKNELVIVGVDLFYWIENSSCWNRHHWEHYSLINGFDDDKNVFYVLDENDIGFGEFEIPVDRFITAIQHSPLEPDGYIYKINKKIKQFKFNIKDVINNAQRLKNELSAIKSSSLWQLRDEDFDAGHMCDLSATEIFQIVNRQIANQLLFCNIQKEVHDCKVPDIIIKYSNDLKEGWILVKNVLLKANLLKDRKLSLAEIEKSCKDLLNKEYEMWDIFVTSLGPKYI